MKTKHNRTSWEKRETFMLNASAHNEQFSRNSVINERKRKTFFLMQSLIFRFSPSSFSGMGWKGIFMIIVNILRYRTRRECQKN